MGTVRQAKSGNDGRRATALIVAMGVLTVLAVLGFTFATVSRAERIISRSYTDQVRARIYAQSGIEGAVAQLRAAIAPDPASMSDAERAAFTIAEGTNAPWVYGGSVAMGRRTPVEMANDVSFPVVDSSLDPITVRIQDRENADGGNDFGVSGFLGGTYSAQGDSYALKVTDAGGRIYINGCDEPGSTTYTPLTDSWKALLDTLGEVLVDMAVTCPHGQTLSDAGLGDRVDAIRGALWAEEDRTPLSLMDLLRDAAPFYTSSAVDRHDYEILREHLSGQSWVNRHVLDPSKLTHPRAHDPNLVYNPTGQFAAAAPVSPQRSALASEWDESWFQGDPLCPGICFPVCDP